MKYSKPKVAIGISGGVDSAVSALLLKQQGYDVFGIFMRNWEAEQDDPHCTAEQDLTDARAVCDRIGIPLETVNFSKDYWDNVFQHCLDEFAKGRTPNPDVLCNREIKFKVLLEHTLALGADFLATGHYVRKSTDNRLLKGIDNNKDQSYFLYMIKEAQLAKALFPVGELEKPAVRKMAEAAGLINYDKKDSTGICFIGERKFKDFLAEFLLAKPGDIKTTDGKVIGKHGGIMFYTIGQRKGLNIGGLKDADETPWYVVDKEVRNNVLIVGQGSEHPLLYRTNLICDDITWINTPPKFPLSCRAKTRYRQQDQACEVSVLNNQQLQVNFADPQRAVTPGQSIVFYQDDCCLGGGIIV